MTVTDVTLVRNVTEQIFALLCVFLIIFPDHLLGRFLNLIGLSIPITFTVVILADSTQQGYAIISFSPGHYLFIYWNPITEFVVKSEIF